MIKQPAARDSLLPNRATRRFLKYHPSLTIAGILLMVTPLLISVGCAVVIKSIWENGIDLATSIKSRSEQVMLIQEGFSKTCFRGFHLIGDMFRGEPPPQSSRISSSIVDPKLALTTKATESATVKRIIEQCGELNERLTVRAAGMSTASFSGEVERLSSYKHIIDSALLIVDQMQTWFAEQRLAFLSDIHNWNRRLEQFGMLIGLAAVLSLVVLFSLTVRFGLHIYDRLKKLTSIRIEDLNSARELTVNRSDELGLLESTFIDVFEELAEEQSQREMLAELIGRTLVQHGREVTTIFSAPPDHNYDAEISEIWSRCRKLSGAALDRIEQFCQDLIIYSDGRLLNQNLHLQSVSLRSLVQRTFLQTEAMAADRTIVLVNDCTEISIVVDENMIGRVLTNVVSNAIKFSPAGSSVTVKNIDSSGFVRVSILDRGKGIEQERAQSLFEPFERGDATSKTDGFGLGLNICRQLIEIHGGKSGLSVRDGGGTEFWFTIPHRSKKSHGPDSVEFRRRPNDKPRAWLRSKILQKLIPIFLAVIASQIVTIGWMCSQFSEVHRLVNNISQQYTVILNASSLWADFFQSSYSTLSYFVFQKSVYGNGARKNIEALRRTLADCHAQEQLWSGSDYPLHQDVIHSETGLNQLTDTLDQPLILDNEDLAARLSSCISFAENTCTSMQEKASENFAGLQHSILLESQKLQQVSSQLVWILLGQAILTCALTYSFFVVFQARLKLLRAAATALLSRSRVQQPACISDELDSVMDTLATASRQLRAIDRRRQQSASALAHDLRLPLQNLKLAAQSFASSRKNTGAWQQVDDSVSNVIASLNRDIELVEGLLMIYRLNSTEKTSALQCASVHHIILECLKDVSEIADTKGVYIEFESHSASNLTLHTEEVSFGQFVRKLLNVALTNAAIDSDIKVKLCNPQSQEVMRINYVRDASQPESALPSTFESIGTASDVYTAVDLFGCREFCLTIGFDLQIMHGDFDEILVSKLSAASMLATDST